MAGKQKGYEYYLLLAIVGRVLIKVFFPTLASIEPILPMAVLVGAKYSAGKGAITGALGYIVSNMLLFSFGPWSWWQALGGVLAGVIGAGYAKNGEKYVLAVIGATVVFEVVMNLYGGAGFIDVTYFWGSSIFGIVHIISNMFFAALLMGALPQANKAKSNSKTSAKTTSK